MYWDNLESYEQIIHRGSNGLKHQDFIKCYISVILLKDMEHYLIMMSQEEKNRKVNIEDNTKLTRKHKGAINFDIFRRISE